MNNDANWFYVFDSTNSLWLQDDERSWGPYRGAAEFSDFELAHDIAARELKNKGADYDGVVIVLADHGQPEAA
jgi:hypothetical protein